MLRPAPVVVAALCAAALAPASAGAAELSAAPGGLQAAILAARSTPGPDTIHLAPGLYPDRVSATSDLDTGVYLVGAGIGVTVLAPQGGDAPILELGANAGSMAISGLTIDGTGTAPTSVALRSRLGSLALGNVRIVQTGTTPKLAPAIDADAGYAQLTLDGVQVVADTKSVNGSADTADGVVNAGGPLVIRDSSIADSTTDAGVAVYSRGPTTIQRSALSHADVNFGYVLRVVNTTSAIPVVVDSSVLQGAKTPLRLDGGAPPSTVTVRGSTISPAATSTGNPVDISAAVAGSTASATIDSSLLLRNAVRTANGTKAFCTYSNVPVASANCPNTGTANNTVKNTKLAVADLLLDANLAPLPGSPALDSGNPAGVAPGESPTDRLGRPRAASSAEVCNAGPGVRDKGAYERYRPGPVVSIAGPASVGAGTPAQFTATTSAGRPAYSWSFGDGAAGGTAASTSHAFATAGPSSATVTVTDAATGCSATASQPVAVIAAVSAGAKDRTAPKLTKVTLGSYNHAKRSATLRLRVSEAGRIVVTAGRIKGKKVSGRHTVSFTVRKAGSVRLTLRAKALKLRRGRYAVSVVARDAAGNASKPVALTLRVR